MARENYDLATKGDCGETGDDSSQLISVGELDDYGYSLKETIVYNTPTDNDNALVAIGDIEQNTNSITFTITCYKIADEIQSFTITSDTIYTNESLTTTLKLTQENYSVDTEVTCYASSEMGHELNIDTTLKSSYLGVYFSYIGGNILSGGSSYKYNAITSVLEDNGTYSLNILTDYTSDYTEMTFTIYSNANKAGVLNSYDSEESNVGGINWETFAEDETYEGYKYRDERKIIMPKMNGQTWIGATGIQSAKMIVDSTTEEQASKDMSKNDDSYFVYEYTSSDDFNSPIIFLTF